MNFSCINLIKMIDILFELFYRVNNHYYYMASSVSGQDEPNRAL